MNETLTMSDTIETGKIRTHHAKIVVECTTGKPYYSIEWFDTAKKEYFLGYSSYNIENVLGWLKEFFEIVEAPKTNADRIRAMSDEELCEFLSQYKFCDICEEGCDNCTYNGDCDKRLLEWLKQPAETHTNADRCVCCGEIIPEGRQVCPNCLATVKNCFCNRP